MNHSLCSLGIGNSFRAKIALSKDGTRVNILTAGVHRGDIILTKKQAIAQKMGMATAAGMVSTSQTPTASTLTPTPTHIPIVTAITEVRKSPRARRNK